MTHTRPDMAPELRAHPTVKVSDPQLPWEGKGVKQRKQTGVRKVFTPNTP